MGATSNEAERNNSLATTAKLSPLPSRQLGLGTLTLLEVVAFFSRGVDDDNFKWLLSTVLDTVMELYSARMPAYFDLNYPWFAKIQRVISEDVSVERFLDVFTTIDASSTDVWKTREIFK